MTRHRLDTRRPFSRTAGLAAGIDARVLEGARFQRIFRGVYVDAGVRPTPELRVAAALVPFDDSAFASHVSAARLHGVPIPTLPEEHVTVTERRHRRGRRGIRCHLAAPDDVTTVGGVRVSDPHRMFVELGEVLPLVDLVVVGDHLVRRRLATPQSLRAYCVRGRLRGAAAARVAAGYVRERVDSPMETRLRMLIVLAGLPEPEVNREVRDEYGVPVRRYDLCYPISRTVVEYDGRQHIERAGSWEADLDRREAIEDDGHRVIVVVSKGIFVEPERTVLRVWKALRERGEPGVPARPSSDWRPHFPGRTRAS
jgi:very-short-patch-repair endonuclease